MWTFKSILFPFSSKEFPRVSKRKKKMLKSIIRTAKGFKPKRCFTTIPNSFDSIPVANPSMTEQFEMNSTPPLSSFGSFVEPNGSSALSESDKFFVNLCFQHTKMGLKDPATFEKALQFVSTKLFCLDALRYVLLMHYFASCHLGKSVDGIKLEVPDDLIMTMAAKVTAQPDFLYLFTPYQLASLVSSFSKLGPQNYRVFDAVASRILHEPTFLSRFQPSELTIMFSGLSTSNSLNRSLVTLLVSRIENDPAFFAQFKAAALSVTIKCASKVSVDCLKLVDMAIKRILTDKEFFASIGPKYLTTIILNISSYQNSIAVLDMAADRIAQDQAFRDSFDPLDTAIILMMFCKRADGNFIRAFDAFADNLVKNDEMFLAFQLKQICSLVFSFGHVKATNSLLFVEKIVESFVQNPGRLKRCDAGDLSNLVYGLKALQIENDKLFSMIRKYLNVNPAVMAAIGSVTNQDAREAMIEFYTA
jgi:hypothetical protein